MSSVRKVRKMLLVAVVAAVVIFSFVRLDSKHITETLPAMLPLRFQVFYKDITERNLGLDHDEHFQKRLHEVSVEKFDDDHNSVFPFLRPEYVPETWVHIPGYYEMHPQMDKKPPVQPFDPRFTLSIYLHWVRLNPGKPVPFHWSDWVDLSDLNKFVFAPKKESCASLFKLENEETRPVEKYCVEDSKSALGFRITEFAQKHERSIAQTLGKAYLFGKFNAPRRIVFLSNDRGSHKVEVASTENDIKYSLLQNNMVENVLSTLETYKVDVLDAYSRFLKAHLRENKNSQQKPEIFLQESQFDIDIDETIKGLEKDENKMTREYVNALKYSKSTDNPGKSFEEVKFLDSDPQKSLGDHHDWRFFNGLAPNTVTQELALHRLVKNFLHFCNSHELTTWIAHGSLLSWYWNGMSFPWDADTDVQMPIQDLHRLAREFNQSLVVENIGRDQASKRLKDMEFNGMGAYFIDVGTSITHRENGNGNNNIDARFTDIHTGLYVDITGLAVSGEKAPSRYSVPAPAKEGSDTKKENKLNKLYNCRNRHFVSMDEVSPLVMTGVQNQVGYIPKNFAPILEHEYGDKGFLKNEFGSHYYVNSLRLWVPSNHLGDYMKDRTGWTNSQRGLGKRDLRADEVKDIGKLTVDDHAALLYNDKLFQEYVVSKDFTLFHEKQMSALLSGRMSKFKELTTNFSESDGKNRALWGDIFLNRVSRGWNYDKELQKVTALAQVHKQNEANRENSERTKLII